MATTTTNFGWDIPQSTDLVKDGATAIAALGQDIDTSLVNLKGGTTGQVLSKTSNTDMAFTWVTDSGDISGVTAGTGISGGGTSGTVTITNSMATAIDAKGDLIAGTGADAFDRLAVGTNNYVLTADSTTATGLKWSAPSSGALVLITSGTLSGSSTTFTNCFSSTYDSYVVIMKDLSGSGSGTVSLTGQGSHSGSLMGINYAGTPSAAVNNNGANPWVMGQVNNGTDSTSVIWDIAFRGDSMHKFTSFWRQQWVEDPITYYGGLQAGSAAAITGFTLGKTAGTWGSGTVRIYGVAK